MYTLDFPSLVSDPKTKRPVQQVPKFPAKRRKTSDNEDESWMDSFCLFDMESSETVSLTSPANQQEKFCLSVQHGSTRHIGVPNSNWVVDSPPETPVLHRGQGDDLARMIDSPLQLSAGVPSTTGVSPIIHPTVSSVGRHVPPIDLSSPQQLPPSVDSTAFAISKLNSSKEPTLLTLTSYPYRIIHSNEAFSRLCRRRTTLIGDSVFDAFDIEGRILPPSLATYPTLEDHLDRKIALVPSFTDDQRNQYWIRCEVRTYPVHKQDGSKALQYFAVCFTPLQPSL